MEALFWPELTKKVKKKFLEPLGFEPLPVRRSGRCHGPWKEGPNLYETKHTFGLSLLIIPGFW